MNTIAVLFLGLIYTTALLASVTDGVYPVSKYDPQKLDTDMLSLDKIIGNANYVGIGESSHASEGFSEERARMIKYLVEKKGFRLILIENPLRITERFTEPYIANCEGKSERSLRGLFPVWRSASTHSLFQWLCDFNQKNPRTPVILKGIDIQDDNLDYFKDLDSLFKILPQLRRSELLKNISSCFGYGLSVEGFRKIRADIFNGKDIGVETNKSCLSGISKLEEFLVKNSWKWSKLKVERAKIALVALRHYQNKMFYSNRDKKLSIEARDEGMAELAVKLRSLYKENSKAIIWAHNAHLCMDGENVVYGPGWVPSSSMGTYLSKKLGKDYAPIALVSYKLKFLDVYSNTPNETLTAIAGSVEELLSQHPAVRHGAFVDLKKNLLIKRRLYNFSVDPYGSKAVPSDQFRGAMFLQESGPLVSPLSPALLKLHGDFWPDE